MVGDDDQEVSVEFTVPFIGDGPTGEHSQLRYGETRGVYVEVAPGVRTPSGGDLFGDRKVYRCRELRPDFVGVAGGNDSAG